jgi:hypothetical protein
MDQTKPQKTEKQRLFTIQEVQNVIYYLKTREVPPGLSKSSKYRFVTRYGSGNYSVEGGNLLKYKDHKDGHLKTVCPVEKTQEILTEMYKNPLTMGTSRDNFFSRIYQMYHGIS